MRVMKIGMMAAVAGLAIAVMADSSVTPATASMSLIRDGQVRTISGLYYRDTTLQFTNCQCFADSAGAVTQALTNVTVQLTVGPTGATTLYTGTVYNAAAGLWACSVSVPTNDAKVLVQVKLIDGSGASFIYPWHGLSTTPALE